MSDFGCFYNPRPAPGRCIKDTRSNVVEDQCQITDNGCVLKQTPSNISESRSNIPSSSSDIGTASLIRVPTRASALKASQIEINSTLNSTLSGPYAAYAGDYDYDGRINKIFLFSDAHYSFDKSCPQPCKTISSTPPGSESCWEIPRLLTDIFDRAAEKGEYVDFYLEIPFLPKNQRNPSPENILEMSRQGGWLYKIFYSFYGCFLKNDCRYRNVRFHYADLRLNYTIDDYKLSTGLNSPQQRIGMDIQKAMMRLGNKMYIDDRNSDKYIEDIDSIVKGLYYSGGQTMQGTIKPLDQQLFEVYLLSDNFTDDAERIMRSLLVNIDPILAEELLLLVIDTKLQVTRNGKNMHRARAQLEALEREGKGELAQNILDFAMKKYVNNVNYTSIITVWDRFMKLYNNFTKSRRRAMGDENQVLGDLIKDAKQFMNLQMNEISSSALLMDVYILARMFRNFPETDHVPSTTKIVYAGGAHIDHYVEFFKNRGVDFNVYGSEEYKNVINFDRCIKIDINKFLY
jgi:hypothetical protein